ncbi:MAG: undecaprenyldiphospho-muramoylpentapeptide beta-N-acetylglucosaminyltransferase [Desulfuromonadaceae bacterium]|nr:undecaprenyldiphospho-muramoylpentapeptide beta-N-acetylglucosaminyltransferase [Desulfuromonadaceae bacterium]
MNYLICGGGTGGHVFPALAIADAIRRDDRVADILFVGTTRGLEARLVPERGYRLEFIEFSGFAGKHWWRKLQVIGQLGKALRHALGLVRMFRPDVVIGVGGYASLPMVMAAGLLRIPVVLHEQNAFPGLANRLAAHWASRVCVALPDGVSGFPLTKAVVTGNPVRRSLFRVRPWRQEPQRLLLFGGSQGAQALNQAMIEALPLLRRQFPALQLLHQTGAANSEPVRQAYAQAHCGDVEVVPFIEDMAAAYEASTLVVCRSGATTIAELAACGRPSLLIPFPLATGDHQTHNARALVAAGAAVLLPQGQLTGVRLAAEVAQLLQDPSQLAQMARQAQTLSAKGAADLIVCLCRRAIERKRKKTYGALSARG